MESSVDQSVIGDEYRCAYCYQLKNDLDDPRVLPCKHVFCCSCISSDYRRGLTIECPVCRVKHIDIIIKDLPRYVKENETSCYVCGVIADMCCKQCSIYMCEEHAKHHDETFASATIFGYKHEKAVALSAVSKVLQRKDKEFCTRHTDEEIRKACSSCYKGLCVECISSEKCSEDKSHIVEKIESLTEKLKKELAQIMSELYVKSTVLCDLDKEANIILADQEKTYGEMKALVDKITKEQMEEIQEKASKIKLAIDDTFKASTDTVNKYCAQLMVNKDVSDGLRRDIHSLINHKSDLDVIKEFENTSKACAEIFKSLPSELSLPVIEIKQLAKQREVEVAISTVCHKTVIQQPESSTPGYQVREIVEPKALAQVSSSPGSPVYSVSWLHNKSLVCGLSGKTEFRDAALKVIKSQSITGTVYSVHPYGTDYLVLLYDNRHKVNLYSSDFTYKRTLITGDFGWGHMAVKDNRILVNDVVSRCVKLYTADGAHVLDVDYQPHIGYPLGMEFQDDQYFIVADYNGGKVLQFKLEANSRPVWTCDSIVAPTGISIDTSGYIFVASYALKTISLLTQSGSLLKQFTPPELYDHLRCLSISGKVLAVGSNRGVQLFQIHY